MYKYIKLFTYFFILANVRVPDKYPPEIPRGPNGPSPNYYDFN